MAYLREARRLGGSLIVFAFSFWLLAGGLWDSSSPLSGAEPCPPEESARLVTDDPNASDDDLFGCSVSISGDFAIAGTTYFPSRVPRLLPPTPTHEKGRAYASSSTGAVSLVDLLNPSTPQAIFAGRAKPLVGLAWAPHGDEILTADADGRVGNWSLAKQRALTVITQNGRSSS